jgi:hypothetical protein
MCGRVLARRGFNHARVVRLVKLSVKLGDGSGWRGYQEQVRDRQQRLEDVRWDEFGTDLVRAGRWVETAPGVCAEFGLEVGTLVHGAELARIVDEGHLNIGLKSSVDRNGRRVVKPGIYNSKNKQIDHTFAVPKSVSALWADSDARTRVVIERSVRDAAIEALKGQAANGLWVNRGTTAATQYRIQAEGLTAAVYLEVTNREHLPHLQVGMIASTIVKGVDGRFSRVYTRTLFGESRASDAQAQAYLRADLTEKLGVVWEQVDVWKGAAEVAGIDPGRCEELTKRSFGVNAYTAQCVAEFTDANGHTPSPAQLAEIREKVRLGALRRQRSDKLVTLRTIERWQAEYDADTGIGLSARLRRRGELWQRMRMGPQQGLPSGEEVFAAATTRGKVVTESWLRRTAWAMVPNETPVRDIADVAGRLTGAAMRLCVPVPKATARGCTPNLVWYMPASR